MTEARARTLLEIKFSPLFQDSRRFILFRQPSTIIIDAGARWRESGKSDALDELFEDNDSEVHTSEHKKKKKLAINFHFVGRSVGTVSSLTKVLHSKFCHGVRGFVC